jgi:hypothetical protein
MRDVYRRTEEHVYVEHIEPHIGHLRENKKKEKLAATMLHLLTLTPSPFEQKNLFRVSCLHLSVG